MENILSQKDLESFRKNGFILVKKFFTEEQIDKLKSHLDSLKESEKDAEENGSYYFIGDAISKNLGGLVFDKKVLNTAKQLLGPKLVYFGESTIMNGIRAKRGFHRDNAGREDPKHSDWQVDNFPIIKMVIYPQNHKKFGSGIKVRKGSHLLSDFIIDQHNLNLNSQGDSKRDQERGRGKIHNVPSQAGDLIIWDLRLAHSVNAIRLKLFSNICFSPETEKRIDKYFPQFLQSKLPVERKFISLAFGAPSPELDNYIAYYVQRGDFHEHWKRSAYNDELLKLAAANNVEIRKPIPEYGSLYTA